MVKQTKKIPIWLLLKFQSLLTLISPELNTRWMYRKWTGNFINLKHPVTFSEKINWLKLYFYRNHPLVIKCSDKCAIRSYVIEAGCPEILNVLYGVYDHPEQIQWNTLPDTFAIKWNFGNGYNIFCFDKHSFDPKAALHKLKKWSRRQPHLYRSVMHYKYIERKIVVERLIKGPSGKFPDDYKIYCFNGEPAYVMLCKNRDSKKPLFYFYSTDWIFAPIHVQKADPANDPPHERPEGIERAIDYARILARPFPFVRIDFYLSDGNPILGEMTFVPSGGFETGFHIEREMLFGKLLTLPDIKAIV